MKPFFVCLDGIDGSGKSTQARLLAAAVENWGVHPLRAFDPPPEGRAAALRQTLLLNGLAAPWAEAYLFLAARAELYQTTIAPALAQGRWVVCERSPLSTVAYQGYGLGLSRTAVRDVGKYAARPTPHLTVVIDLPPDAATARLSGKHKDLIEERGPQFFGRVRDGFLAEAALTAAGYSWEEGEDGGVAVVDGVGPEGAVADRILDVVTRFLEKR